MRPSACAEECPARSTPNFPDHATDPDTGKLMADLAAIIVDLGTPGCRCYRTTESGKSHR